MEYILLTAFMGCAIVALGPRIVFVIMCAIPASFVALFLAFNSPLSPWCNPAVAKCNTTATASLPPLPPGFVLCDPTTCPDAKPVQPPRASYAPNLDDPSIYDCKAPLGQASSFKATRKQCRDAGGRLEFDPDEWLHKYGKG